MTGVYVVFGAAVGAPTRYLVDRAIQARHQTRFPVGTTVVNIAASLLLGVVVGYTTSAPTAALIGTGFCGALSTYSTFGYETMRLRRQGHRAMALGYVVLSVVLGLGAAAAGYLVGTAL